MAENKQIENKKPVDNKVANENINRLKTIFSDGVQKLQDDISVDIDNLE